MNEHERPATSKVPSLPELFGRYLERRLREPGGAGGMEVGEVVPHEAMAHHPPEAGTAWCEAIAVVEYYRPGAAASLGAAPVEWPEIVAAQEPAMLVPFCLGSYPQLVRNFQLLLNPDQAAALSRPTSGVDTPALVEDAARAIRKSDYPRALVLLGCLRLARRFDTLDEMLPLAEQGIGAEWQAALANEHAATDWCRGKREKALRAWRAQGDSVPVLFNRGLAAWALGGRGEGRGSLERAVSGLPARSVWHHLGKLYVTLAEVAA